MVRVDVVRVRYIDKHLVKKKAMIADGWKRKANYNLGFGLSELLFR